MRKAIEKATRNDLLGLKNDKVLIVERNKVRYHPTFPQIKEIQIWRYTREGEDHPYSIQGVWSGSLPDLIGLTDFIDKLVGETRHCDLTKVPCVVKDCEDYINSGIGPCVHLKYCNLADHHRSKLANMSLERMKVYIRGMV